MKKLLAILIAGIFAMGTVTVSAQTPAPAPIAPAAPAKGGGDSVKSDTGAKAEKRTARKAGKKAGKKGSKKSGKKKADGNTTAPAPK